MAKPTREQLDAATGALSFKPEVTPVEQPREQTNFVAPPSDLQREQMESDAPRSSWLDSVSSSWTIDNTAGRFMDHYDDPNFLFDPNYTEEKGLEFTQRPDIAARLDVMPNQDEVGALMGTANNEAHAEFLLQSMERELELEAIANEHITARFAGAMLDPVDAAVTVATMGTAGAALKLNRVRRIVGSAATAGASNAATEGVVAADSPFRDEVDVGFAALAGIALGAPLGALGTIGMRNLDDEAQAIAERAANHHYGKDAGAARRVIDEEAGTPLEAAARTEFITRPLEEDGFIFGWVQKVQHNLISRTLHSPNAAVRGLGARMMEGGHQARGTTRVNSAEGRAKLIDHVLVTRIYADTLEDFSAWSKRNGYGGIRTHVGSKPGEEFWTEMSVALRGGEASPEVMAAAAKVRPRLNDIWQMAQDAGVKGFEGSPLENFLPRMYHPDKWLEAHSKFGEKNLAGFFRENILNNSEFSDMGEELAQKIALGFVRSVTNNKAGIDAGISHGIDVSDVERLREILTIDGDSSLADDIAEQLTAWQARRAESKGAGNVRHGQQRINFGELEEGEINLKDGSGTASFKLTNVTENHSGRLLQRYVGVMAGHIGMAKEAGIRSRADFDAAIKQIQRDALANNEKVSDAVAALEDVYKMVTGTSIEANPLGGGAQTSRFLSAVQYVLHGGAFGMAQIPELGNVIGEAGILQFMKHIPEYAQLHKRMVDGDLELPIARRMEHLLGTGTDLIRNPAISNFDEAAGTFTNSGVWSKLMQKLDPTLKTASRATNIMSLMAPINAFLQRSSALTLATKHADWATGKRKLKPGDVSRLRENGIDAAMQKRIFASLREAAIYKNGRLEDIDVAKWTDKESLDAFQMAGNRWTRQTIQENDVGNISSFLHTPLGRALTPFMSFMFNSISKQLLHGIKHRDIQVFSSWTTAMFLAGLAYQTRTYINYANDPKKRAELLTPEKIAKAAFARAGFAAVLPPVVDTTLNMAGFDAQFSGTRTSGLSTNLLSGNANVQLFGDLMGTAKLPGSLLHDDYQFSQQDTARFNRMMPFHNLLGVRNALALINDELPKTSEK